MKTKKIISTLLVCSMLFSMSFVNASALNGSKTITSKDMMSITMLNENMTGESTAARFSITNLPAGALITDIQVTGGTQKVTGVLAVTSMRVTVPSGLSENASWTGDIKTSPNFKTQFDNTPANGVYEVRFTGRAFASYVGSTMIHWASRSYDRPNMTIFYTY